MRRMVSVLRAQLLVVLPRALGDEDRLDRFAGSITTSCARARWRPSNSTSRHANQIRRHMVSSSSELPKAGATYAGNSRSLVRYTFTRCPSRIVIVGRRFRNRFMTCSVACDVASPTPPAMITVRSPSPRPSPALPRYCDSPLINPTAAAAPNVDEVVLVDAVLADRRRRSGSARGIGRGGTSGRPASAAGERRRPVAFRRSVWTGFVSPSTPSASRNQDVLTAVRVERIRHQAVHGSRSVPSRRFVGRRRSSCPRASGAAARRR